MRAEGAIPGCFAVLVIGLGIVLGVVFSALPLVLAGWLLGLGS